MAGWAARSQRSVARLGAGFPAFTAAGLVGEPSLGTKRPICVLQLGFEGTVHNRQPMLVLLGPTFQGDDDQYRRLAELSGLTVYDLRTKLKPGCWGVVRSLADEAQAKALLARLRDAGLPVVGLDIAVAFDPTRKVVPVRALTLQDESLMLLVGRQEMTIDYRALMVIVRGEVRPGADAESPRSLTPASSSSTFRAVVPDAGDMKVFREAPGPANYAAFAAADLHFATVPWFGRIDARHFNFASVLAETTHPVNDLESLVDRLAKLSNTRVDRAHKTSSLASFCQRAPRRVQVPAGIAATSTPEPASWPGSLRSAGQDARFDAYSRAVAESERLARGLGVGV